MKTHAHASLSSLTPIRPDFASLAKFREFVELKDYRPPTKKEYVRYVRRLSEHFRCDPATLTEDQVRSYFLCLRQERRLSGSALSIAQAALQLFFREHLGRTDWKVFSELVIRRGQPLPRVLSREEVQRVLGVLRVERFRVCLRLIYGCGLRVGEAVGIQVTDIDGAQLRLHLRNAKGGRDRCVPLTARLLEELRAYWKTHRHPVWLFPAPGCAWRSLRTATARRGHLQSAATHLSVSAVQNAFRLARAETKLHPQATVHTLRRVKGFASRGKSVNFAISASCSTSTCCNPNRTTDFTLASPPICVADYANTTSVRHRQRLTVGRGG